MGSGNWEGSAYNDENMSIFLLVAQTLLHCPPLRSVQLSVGELDPWFTRWQLGPFQRIERISRKEYFPDEWAGEERILTLECVQDQGRTGDFSTGEIILANGENRFDLCGEFRVRGDSDGSAVNLGNVSLNIPFVGLESDVL